MDTVPPGISILGPAPSSALPETESQRSGGKLLDSDQKTIGLDKSNVIMLGPTGSGESELKIKPFQ